LSLHGHIHESRGRARIGNTILINPGSVCSEAALQGTVIDLTPDLEVVGLVQGCEVRHPFDPFDPLDSFVSTGRRRDRTRRAFYRVVGRTPEVEVVGEGGLERRGLM
jgi:hypothetical protein